MITLLNRTSNYVTYRSTPALPFYDLYHSANASTPHDDPVFLRSSSVLERFSTTYQSYHGYISLVVCFFGIVSNVMNVVILTRKNMITATNYILTALAVADMLTMLSYMPYAVYFYCVAVLDERHPHARGWIVYLLFNTNFNITCHTAAMWLTVSVYLCLSLLLSGFVSLFYCVFCGILYLSVICILYFVLIYDLMFEFK